MVTALRFLESLTHEVAGPQDTRVFLSRSHLFHVAAVLCMAGLAVVPAALALLPRVAYEQGSRPQNLAAHLSARHHLRIRPEEIVLPHAASAGLRPQEVYFLAARPGSPLRDLYFAHVILSDRGIPVHASPAFSLSNTSAADEQELRYDGQRYLAYASAVEDKVSVVTVMDLQGLSAAALGDFSALQRLQQRLTNWQESGRWRGLDRIEVQLTVPQRVSLAWEAGTLHVHGAVGGWEVIVDPRQAKVLRGPAQATQLRVGKRSFLPWAVDTVRSFSWIGPEKIAWLEDTFYGVVDRARRLSGAQVTVGDIKDEMALPVIAASSTGRIDNWPPPPLPTILRPPIKGEGQWMEVQGPFLRAQPNLPSLFAMTFVRPDSERLFAKVYFVAWDARRLELHMVGGTSEPRSSTGEQGRGIIPRDVKLLPHLVAGFNGGFQSMHGDFGMMEERKVYCPPKPWAATVARLADGATGFGTWDGNAKADWVPGYISSFRQNLTPFVEDGQFNPWRRGSWGGGAGFLTGSGPKAFIIRSALCLHKSGHVMYALGDPIDGPTLGKALHRVGCNYAIQLDINRGHVGFEFFNVLAPGEKPPANASSFREERTFARSGDVSGVDGVRYMMREVVRGTGNYPVPRYLGREARDFFYLVLRDSLPGPDLPAIVGRGAEGRWTSAALPAAATRFPQALARAFLHANKTKPDLRVHLVKLDMRWMEGTVCLPRRDAGCLPEASAKDPPLAILPLGAFGAARALYADGKLLVGTPGSAANVILRPRRPEGPALPQLSAQPDRQAGSISVQSAPQAATVTARQSQAALCVSDDGVLLYAAGLGANSHDLEQALQAAGCKRVVHLGGSEPLLLAKAAGFETVYGDALPPLATSPSLLLRRSRACWGCRIFTHVKVQPRSVWTAVQPERTRASTLVHAKRAAEALGLPPPTNLGDLCKPPYYDVKELRQYRWRDPQTGKTCAEEPSPKKRRRRKATPQ
jgi:hypothetical protein